MTLAEALAAAEPLAWAYGAEVRAVPLRYRYGLEAVWVGGSDGGRIMAAVARVP